MPDPQEVVIVGKDGKEHVFPAGFDPKLAAQIVRDGGGTTPRESAVLNFRDNATQSLVDTLGGMASGMASTIAHPIDTSKGVLRLLASPKQTAGQVADYAKRYAPGQIENTLLTDPFGALADVSTLAAGTGAALRLAPKASALSKAGKVADTISTVTNPATVPQKIVGSALKGTGMGVAHMSVRPGTELNRQTFGDKYRIAKEVASKRLSTPQRASDNFTNAIEAAAKKADQPMPPVDRARLVAFPKTLNQVSTPGMSGIDELAGIEAQLNADLPAQVPFRDLFDYSKAWNKEGQWNRAAMPSGTPPVRGAAFKELADNTRQALYEAPGLKEANKQVQTAMLANAAVENAAARPHALTRMFALMGMSQPATAGAMLLSDSPRIGANVGGGLWKAGEAVDSKALARALLLARMQQQAAEQGDDR